MKSFSAKTVCEGVLVSALTVILVLIGNYVPVIRLLAVFVCGLPITYLIIKHGIKIALTSFVVSLILLLIITGNVINVMLTACVVLLPGLAAGYSMSRNNSYYSTFFAVSAAVLFGIIVNIMMIDVFTGGENGIAGIIDDAISTAKSMILPAVQEAENSGVTDITGMLDSMFAQTKTLFLSYFPTMLIIYSLTVGYLVLASAVFFMKRLRVKNYGYVKFSMIKAPKSMSFVLVILMFISFFSNDMSVYTLVLKNVTAVLSFILAVNGLSLVDFSLKRKIKSGYARFGIYMAVMILGYFIMFIIFYILMLVGMIDSNRDIRMLKRVGGDSEN